MDARPTSYVRMRFGANLRRRRLQAGLSQQTLAAGCNLDRAEISAFERGLRSPRLDTIVMLARALGLAVAGELIEDID
jgi:transcriptional regulator with XRE-family HTH domain